VHRCFGSTGASGQNLSPICPEAVIRLKANESSRRSYDNRRTGGCCRAAGTTVGAEFSRGPLSSASNTASGEREWPEWVKCCLSLQWKAWHYSIRFCRKFLNRRAGAEL